MCPASFKESAFPKHRVRLWSTAFASGGCVRLWSTVCAFGACKYTGLPARIRREIGLSATLVGMIVHESSFG